MAKLFIPLGDALTLDRGMTFTPKWRAWVRQISDTVQGIVDGAMSPGAYDAGFFTASGGGSWTVEEADAEIAWFQSGRVVTLSIQIADTTIAGAPVELRLQLPNDFIPARTSEDYIFLKDDAVHTPGRAMFTENSTILAIVRLDGAAFTNTTDNTSVLGTVIFEAKP